MVKFVMSDYTQYMCLIILPVSELNNKTLNMGFCHLATVRRKEIETIHKGTYRHKCFSIRSSQIDSLSQIKSTFL